MPLWMQVCCIVNICKKGLYFLTLKVCILSIYSYYLSVIIININYWMKNMAADVLKISPTLGHDCSSISCHSYDSLSNKKCIKKWRCGSVNFRWLFFFCLIVNCAFVFSFAVQDMIVFTVQLSTLFFYFSQQTTLFWAEVEVREWNY